MARTLDHGGSKLLGPKLLLLGHWARWSFYKGIFKIDIATRTKLDFGGGRAPRPALMQLRILPCLIIIFREGPLFDSKLRISFRIINYYIEDGFFCLKIYKIIFFKKFKNISFTPRVLGESSLAPR